MFRLALALGRTVTELEQQMSGRELIEWIAYATLEPFGEQRADLRSAITSCVVANSFSTRRYSPKDFMPNFDQSPQDNESIGSAILAWANAARNVTNGYESITTGDRSNGIK